MKKLFGLLKPTHSGGKGTKEDLTLSDGEEQKHQMPPHSFPPTMLSPPEHNITAEDGHADSHSQASTKEKESTSGEGEHQHYKLDEIKRSMYERKVRKFDKVLSQKVIDLEQLRALSWNGSPIHSAKYRCTVWKLLLDYIPNDQEI